MAEEIPKRFAVAVEELPKYFPTHAHESLFWESLGRAVATFGFLEEVLGKAIFSLSATRPYKEDEIQKAFEKWLPTLEHALVDTLNPLISSFERQVKEHPKANVEGFDDLLSELRKAAELRNIICHGSWRLPSSTGACRPFFVDQKRRIFDGSFDAQSLIHLQHEVAKLACIVISTVTHMGLQFPGSNGPGKVIWDTESPK
jgi:hypothetical protein